MKTLARPRDKAEILQRLKTVRQDSVRRWGRMSAHGMVCHLADAFRMGTGDKPSDAVGSVFHHTMLKWLVLYAPLRWPSGIVTTPEIDQDRGGTKPVDFAADLAALESLMERVTTQPKAFEWRAHPVFGVMSESAWLRWGYLHADHHLRQFGA